MVNKVEGGILAAKGYSVASKRIGIKPKGENRDLTLIKCDVPATVVGTFTRNVVKAAPYKLKRGIKYRFNAILMDALTTVARRQYRSFRFAIRIPSKNTLLIAAGINANDKILTAKSPWTKCSPPSRSTQSLLSMNMPVIIGNIKMIMLFNVFSSNLL